MGESARTLLISPSLLSDLGVILCLYNLISLSGEKQDTAVEFIDCLAPVSGVTISIAQLQRRVGFSYPVGFMVACDMTVRVAVFTCLYIISGKCK